MTKNLINRGISTLLILTVIITGSMVGLPQSICNTEIVNAAEKTYSYRDYTFLDYYEALKWIQDGEMDKFEDYLSWLLYMDKEGVDKAEADGVKMVETDSTICNPNCPTGPYCPAKELYYYLLEVKSAYKAWNDIQGTSAAPDLRYAKKSTLVYASPSKNSNYLKNCGISRGAEVYVIEDLSNGWSKVIVTRPHSMKQIVERTGICSTYFDEFVDYAYKTEEKNTTIGYVMTKNLRKTYSWKYNMYDQTLLDNNTAKERKKIEKRMWENFWKDVPQRDKLLYIIQNINSDMVYFPIGRRAAYGIAKDDYFFGGRMQDSEEYLTRRLIVERKRYTKNWNSYDDPRSTDIHETVHALEEYIQTCSVSKRSISSYNELDIDITDLGRRYIPMVFDEEYEDDPVSWNYINDEGCEVISYLIDDTIGEARGDFNYYKVQIKERDSLWGGDPKMASFNTKKRAKEAIKEAQDYIDAAYALVYAQHVLSYYLYAQDAGLIAKPSYYTNEKANIIESINAITEDDLREEITIKCEVGDDSLKQYEGTYTLSEFKGIIETVVDNDSSFILECNELKDNNAIVPGYKDLWYFSIFFYNGEVNEYPEVTVNEIFKNFPVKAYGTTHLSAFLTTTKVSFRPESYDLQYNNYEELLKNSEHGKAIIGENHF